MVAPFISCLRERTVLMKNECVFSKIRDWLKSTELFSRPSLEVPGVWHLFEYYAEPEGHLVHFIEGDMVEKHLYWEIALDSEGRFRQKSNLPIQLFPGNGICNWHIKSNFIILSHPQTREKGEKYQFAMDRRVLKLLKKDSSGRIEIFGFFRKVS